MVHKDRMLCSGKILPLAALWILASSSSLNFSPFALASVKRQCRALRNGEAFVLALSSPTTALLQGIPVL